MKIKICGMRDAANIDAVAALQTDYIGFVFYPGSLRYIGKEASIPALDPAIRKVGVFVNEPIPYVLDTAKKYQLEVIQLHGDEDFDYCKIVRSNKLELIKAISISDHLPVNRLMSYMDCVDYFLFDTATPHFGGSGHTFDWSLLQSYNLNIPFFISGGIGVAHIDHLKEFSHPQFTGVDANSRLESSPGLKDIIITEQFIKTIKNGKI